MNATTYTALKKDLQKLQKTLVASQIAAVRRDPNLTFHLERLHAEAEVGGRVDDFVATAARKSTVLFLLRTVFVRVLEDLGILGVKRIRDDWGFAAFREVAPALGYRAYFAFVFRDLAVDFPALFAPGDDELPIPDEDGCVAVWHLWHHPNRDGQHYTWDAEGFDSRFLGDLYQDLDADVRKRYALLQTPRFVEAYILDHTLTPALAEFDPAILRADGETFRLLDPTCGSGHFVIGGFHRLADYWRDKHGLSEWDAGGRALECVWGADINEHAVEIAAFRLLLEVVARTGVKNLERLAKLRLNLRTMDSLIPWERAKQGVLLPAFDRLNDYATSKQRRENAAFLAHDFHVVVGNPPYITPKDVRKRDDYRLFWPDSAAGKYALSAPFAERFFALGTPGAYIGQITANSFMKREFGKKLVTVALPRVDLTAVIDTSGTYIPGHGTPTVIMIGRHRRPTGNPVWAVLGKRGEPRRPEHAERGLVWTAITALRLGDERDDSPFVTAAVRDVAGFREHPWSLGGGQAGDIKQALEEGAHLPLHGVVGSIGNLTKMIADEMYFDAPPAVQRDVRCRHIILLEGEYVRDWEAAGVRAIFPYELGSPAPLNLPRDWAAFKHFWAARGLLWERRSRASKFAELRTIPGAKFYEYPFYAPHTTTGLGICFGFVATHNHFVLDRGGKVFNRSAPVIKLPATATLDDHFDLLGLLNSSTLGFWMKQVFHSKGSSSGDAIRSEDWEPSTSTTPPSSSRPRSPLTIASPG